MDREATGPAGSAGSSGSMSKPRPVVLLFRSPQSSPSEGVSDLYEATLSQGGYHPISIPVLRERFILEEVKEVIKQGGEEWEGIIITSRRGAEGWVRAARELQEEAGRAQKKGEEGMTSRQVDWTRIPLWTVGNAAIDVVNEALASIPFNLLPSDGSGSTSGSIATETGGDHQTQRRTSKSANGLLPLLLSSASPQPSRPYLIIRGDKSLDEIPTGLIQAGRATRQIIVYETVARDNIPLSVQSAVEEIQRRSASAISDGRDIQIWLGFFSPSSAGMALPHLSAVGNILSSSRVFAIGETTRSYLESQGLTVQAVAEEPNAEGILQALRRADSIS